MGPAVPDAMRPPPFLVPSSWAFPFPRGLALEGPPRRHCCWLWASAPPSLAQRAEAVTLLVQEDSFWGELWGGGRGKRGGYLGERKKHSQPLRLAFSRTEHL